jgi:hypothetical protein
MRSTDNFKKTIREYLEKRAAGDPAFGERYRKEGKNIDDCITYILNTVKSSGCNGFEDEEIYGMAVHYYDEEKIDVGSRPSGTVVINHKVELSEEEKNEAREKARKDFEEIQLRELRQSEERRIARKEAEQRKREIEKYNKVFRKQKARYFGIEFTDGEINVRVLDDVKDYFIEGKELQHCVFTSSYFNKKDTLILSARKGDERIATVEISLKEWKVLQCRGRNNSVPPYYQDIVRLVTGNIEVFKKRVRMHEAA